MLRESRQTLLFLSLKASSGWPQTPDYLGNKVQALHKNNYKNVGWTSDIHFLNALCLLSSSGIHWLMFLQIQNLLRFPNVSGSQTHMCIVLWRLVKNRNALILPLQILGFCFIGLGPSLFSFKLFTEKFFLVGNSGICKYDSVIKQKFPLTWTANDGGK